jgi:hypothetical protein
MGDMEVFAGADVLVGAEEPVPRRAVEIHRPEQLKCRWDNVVVTAGRAENQGRMCAVANVSSPLCGEGSGPRGQYM